MRVWAGIEFQSTLPRRSDDFGWNVHHSCFISIHAPAKERLMRTRLEPGTQYFNPRSREGATESVFYFQSFHRFQSTLPRRSDLTNLILSRLREISIHAPAKERRHLPPIFFLQHTIFTHILHKSYFSKSSNQLR